MVNPPALVHRPQSRSMKDLVHLLLPRVRFTCTTWSWSELSGAARDVVGVVMVGARQSYSGHGWRGHGRSSAELLGTWSMREKSPPLPNRAPTGGEVIGELLGRYWCAIKVGKSVAKPRRVQWWGQGGGWGFLGFRPR